MFWQTAYASTVGLPQASTIAPTVDLLYDFLFYLSLISTILVTVAMLYFVVKYHRSKTGRETAYILDSHTLEILWTVVPLFVMLFIFAWGFEGYRKMRQVPKDAVEINITGRQWMWSMEYTNGRKTLNQLVVPRDKPVKLIMTSEDVLHSFFIPNFRVKQDVVPGRYTTIYFQATKDGVDKIFCAEYCGAGHSNMLGKVVVVEPAEYDHWLATGDLPTAIAEEANSPLTEPEGEAPSKGGSTAGATPADKGKALFASKGCTACHTVDGSRLVGPSLKGVFGSKVELNDGTTVDADENYIRKSIMDPSSQIVKGFTPAMPQFGGLLKDEEVNDLIAYIKSLK